jgi:hypothetical protein
MLPTPLHLLFATWRFLRCIKNLLPLVPSQFMVVLEVERRPDMPDMPDMPVCPS